MEQNAHDAEHRGVQIKPSVEDCVEDTEHIATQTKKTAVELEFKNSAFEKPSAALSIGLTYFQFHSMTFKYNSSRLILFIILL